MMIEQVNLQSDVELCFASLASKAKCFVLAFLSVFILLPGISQASGLFDFQMKLAEKGNAEAQYKVGEMYETGFGVKKDMAKANDWINKAASQGHETADFKLLYWDLEKNGVNGTNKAKFDALEAKAKAENPHAQFYLGKMFAYGVGMKKDTDKAIDWLNKAASVGVLEAEREIVVVREDKQHQALAQRRAEEKKRAELKAQREQENLARQEAQRKLQAQKQAEAKARAAAAAKQNKASDAARQQASKDASEQEKAKIKAQNEAQKQAQEQQKQAQEEAEALAEAKAREAKKQALLDKRSQDESARKTEFESDPCSGKSARFLSTCK